MLIADQGFGDGIQFSRYIPWAAKRCDEVVVACSRELQPLIGQIPGITELFDRWEECAGLRRLSAPERPAAAARHPAGYHPRGRVPYLQAGAGAGRAMGRASTSWSRRATAASAWSGPAGRRTRTTAIVRWR